MSSVRVWLIRQQICSGAQWVYLHVVRLFCVSFLVLFSMLLLRSQCVSRSLSLLHHSKKQLTRVFPLMSLFDIVCGSREVLISFFASARPSLQKLWRVSDTFSSITVLVTLHLLIREQFLVFSCPCLIEDENNVKFVWCRDPSLPLRHAVQCTRFF